MDQEVKERFKEVFEATRLKWYFLICLVADGRTGANQPRGS